MTSLWRVTVRLRRRLLRHRRLLGAIAAGAAAFCLAQVAAPPAPETTRVVVVTHDLPGGSMLRPDDLRTVSLPSELVPDGTAASAEAVRGDVLAAPVRAGEPVTDRRLVGEALVAAYGPGRVAAPLRIADPDVVRLIEVGDHVDVYAAGRDASSPGPVVMDVPVVTVPPADETSGGHDGALLVLAVTSSEAAELAEASAEAVLSISLRGPNR